MLNNQKPEKPIFVPDGTLEVHSIFPTIQGEGPFSGKRATFIRLAGCNLQCPMCDTDYTTYKFTSIPDLILEKVLDYLPRLVVITGGEPFRQNLRPLVELLIANGFFVQIETNGTLYQPLPYHDSRLVIICSPKTGKIHPQLAFHIKALKYIIEANSILTDGLPIRALGHPNTGKVARPPKGFSGTVYVQPADSQDEEKNQQNLKETIESTISHGYTLCLQIHKIIGVA